MGVDHNTSSFYDRYAARLAQPIESPSSAMLPYVLEHLCAGAAVLDVGAGSGRDVAALIDHGYDAFGIEPNDAMRDRAISTHPRLVGRIRRGALPGLGVPFRDVRPDGFDAVICSAVLMHLDEDELPDAAADLLRQLRAVTEIASARSQLLFISIPEMDQSRLAANRDSEGRMFINHRLSYVQKLLGEAGTLLITSETSHAALQSTATLWHTLVFQRSGS